MLMYSDEIELQTDYGVFNSFVVKENDNEHFVLYKGDIKNKECLVRVHSECLTGDLFGSLRCDCGSQLKNAMVNIARNNGVLIYLRQEGRGIGLLNKIKAYKLQDKGLDTVDANIELGFAADSRKYNVAIDILRKLSPAKILLMTNNPRKIEELKRGLLGIGVERVPLISKIHKNNKDYLITKQKKMNHLVECNACRIK